MTAKEQYEARKAQRDKLRELDDEVRNRTEAVLMLDILDRAVTAIERIADAITKGSEKP